MRIADMNWMQVEAYLAHDDRAVLPIGSTEQHAYLSLEVDSILSERVAVDAAEPLGIPVFPALPFGFTPYFRAYPGTVSLRLDTFLAVVRDVLDSLYRSGFRRFLIVNGHGGNLPAAAAAGEWAADRPGARVRFHNWWNAPQTWRKVQEIDPVASHASWMENFPWTRLGNVAQPAAPKPPVDHERLRLLTPEELRLYVGDGNYGGHYEKPDEAMMALWQAAVTETRALLQGPWE